MKKLGVIGATFEAAADFVKLLGRRSERRFPGSEHPEIILHLPKRSEFLLSEISREKSWASILLRSVEILSAAGAELVLCPSNGAHVAYPIVKEQSPLPWIPLPEVVAEACHAAGFSKVGLIGTSYLLESTIYSEAFSRVCTEIVLPEEQIRGEIHRIIREELFYGRVEEQTVALLNSVLSSFEQSGCQGVALICTELQLALSHLDSPLPLLDSLELLAEAALLKVNE